MEIVLETIELYAFKGASWGLLTIHERMTKFYNYVLLNGEIYELLLVIWSHLNIIHFFNFIEKETLAQVFFCKFCEIFKNTYFYRTPLVVAFKYKQNMIIYNRITQKLNMIRAWIFRSRSKDWNWWAGIKTCISGTSVFYQTTNLNF